MRTWILALACVVSLSAAAITVATTAGNLRADMAGNEPHEITELTVTGTLDARDFRFIADSLSALATLDISEVSIVPYKHTSVSAIASQLDFEADALPPTSLMGKPLTSLALPSTLRIIGEAALAGCTSLAELSLPATLDSIGPFAFSSCTALKTVQLPANVTRLAEGAFAYCTALESFTVASGSRLSVVGPRALADCPNLSSINLGSAVTSLGQGAMAMTALTALDLHAAKRLATIDGWTATGASITSVSLPPSVVHIGDGTMFAADEVTEVELPKTVAYIGDYAMAGMTGLQTITTRATVVPALGEDVWWEVDQPTVHLKVPRGTADDYGSTYIWQKFLIEEDLLRGDVNLDGHVDVGDVNAVLSIILAGGTADSGLRQRADVNNDGAIDVGDVNAILSIILTQNAPQRK